MIAGSTSITGSTYAVRAGGIDIWDTSDQFRFVYRQITGDVDTPVTAVALFSGAW